MPMAISLPLLRIRQGPLPLLVLWFISSLCSLQSTARPRRLYALIVGGGSNRYDTHLVTWRLYSLEMHTKQAKGEQIILSNSTYQQISLMALRTPNTRIGSLRLESCAAVILTLSLLLLQLLQESLLVKVLLLIVLLVALLMGKCVCQVSFYSCCLQCRCCCCFFFCRHCSWRCLTDGAAGGYRGATASGSSLAAGANATFWALLMCMLRRGRTCPQHILFRNASR